MINFIIFYFRHDLTYSIYHYNLFTPPVQLCLPLKYYLSVFANFMIVINFYLGFSLYLGHLEDCFFSL